jgi:hypothetical protein
MIASVADALKTFCSPSLVRRLAADVIVNGQRLPAGSFSVTTQR